MIHRGDIMEQNQCEHPNAYYYGDTNPVTYYCPDCGIFFVKGNYHEENTYGVQEMRTEGD
jgi:hypothetical protein